MLDNKDNILLQGLYNVLLLQELHKHDFIHSPYFNEFPLHDELKNVFQNQIGLGNRGMVLSFLYTLLVVPKEIFSTPNGVLIPVNQLNGEIKSIVLIETITSYDTDLPEVDYIRHIRNSVAHANAEFIDEKIIFYDSDRFGHACEIHLTLGDVGHIIFRLTEMLTEYSNVKAKELKTNGQT